MKKYSLKLISNKIVLNYLLNGFGLFKFLFDITKTVYNFKLRLKHLKLLTNKKDGRTI